MFFMHYFQFLLIFKINQTCPVSFPYPHSKKSKKIPQTSQYGLTAGSNPHIIYSVCAIQCRLHDALSQHSLNHLLKSGDISTSHIVARNMVTLCCL